MGRAKRAAANRGHREATDLPRIEELDDSETGSFSRLELDESLYELTVLPVLRAGRPSVRVKSPAVRLRPNPPLPRIGYEHEDLDTDIVSADALRRLRAEAKVGRGDAARDPSSGEAFEGLWEEIVGPDPDAETPSGVRKMD